MSQPFDVAALAATYANKSPQDILKLAFEHFGDDLWISFSGAEDVVLVDMAWKLNKQVKVFSLDTGRLHPETYRFIDQVREQYNLPIEILSPDRAKLDPFVKERACSASTRTAMASAAAFARSSRCDASWPPSAPGPPASAATKARAPAARWRHWKSTAPFPRLSARCTSSTHWRR